MVRRLADWEYPSLPRCWPPAASVPVHPINSGGNMKAYTIAAAVLVSAGLATQAYAQEKKAAKKAGGGDMTFFVTSEGSGKGADLGGLEGADAKCQELAKAVGSKHTDWHAYLSTTKPGGEAGE